MLPHAGSTSMDDDFSSKWKKKEKRKKRSDPLSVGTWHQMS